MDTFFQDIRFGIRSLWKQPAFTAIAVITIALGIGGSTAMFSVVNAVLLKPFPFRDPEQLVRVESRNSYPDMADWIEQSQTGESFGGYATFFLDLTQGDEPERIPGLAITGSLFPLLGVNPALGRTLEPDDDLPGGARVVLLSDGFWKRHLGSDPEIVGKPLSFNGNQYTVLGVMPMGFQLPLSRSEIWVPARVVMPEASAARGAHMFQAVGVSKPMWASAGRYGQHRSSSRGALPGGEPRPPVRSRPVTGVRRSRSETRAPDSSRLGRFVLLIACANVANLLLARGAARQREIAVRAALGAGRARLFRQLLTESVLLSLAGGALAAPLAFAIVRGVIALGAGSIPRLDEIALDGVVMSFALGISALTGSCSDSFPRHTPRRPASSNHSGEGGRTSGTFYPEDSATDSSFSRWPWRSYC